MTDRDVFLPVSAQPSLDALTDQAERGEELGYDRAWVPETWGRDAVTVLSAIAERTDEIGIGSDIIPIYSRSPALIGQTAATLQELSDGRMRLGVGPSGPIVIENWHGVEFGNPLKRTRETIDVVKQVLSGETVEYDGDYFDLGGFRLRCEAPDPAPPVDAAGMGPKAVELAGRFADGWQALLFTQDGLADRLEDLERGAELAGKSLDDVKVTLSLTCAALEDRERARQLVRQHVAFYVGGMGTYYRDNLARQGHEDVAETVHEKWNDGDREAAMAALDDDLLDSIAVAGTPAEARDHVEEFAGIEGVDAINVSFPRGADLDEVDETMEALAPE